MKHAQADRCPGETCKEPACLALKVAKAGYLHDAEREEAVMRRFDKEGTRDD